MKSIFYALFSEVRYCFCAPFTCLFSRRFFSHAAEQQLRKSVQQCQQCLQLSQREQGVDRHHVGEFKEEY